MPTTTSALYKVSIIPDSTITVLVEHFKQKDSNVRDSAAEPLGNHSTLFGKVLEALGLVVQSEIEAGI